MGRTIFDMGKNTHKQFTFTLDASDQEQLKKAVETFRQAGVTFQQASRGFARMGDAFKQAGASIAQAGKAMQSTALKLTGEHDPLLQRKEEDAS